MSRWTMADVVNAQMRMHATVECADCKTPIVRRSGSHIYCEPCSNTRRKASASKYSRKHPPTKDTLRRRYSEDRAESRANGLVLSEGSSRTLAWMSEPVRLTWVTRFMFPFTYALSKNSIYRLNGQGHVALRRETNEVRNALILTTQAALEGRKILEGKVWIDLLVQKPNHRGDAVNVVDTVCDALKKAVDVDDRWFCINRLDWEIVKTDPQIYIGIGQEVTEPHRACSMCGRVLPHPQFYGLGRECVDCKKGQTR